MTEKEAIKVIDGRFDIMDYCENVRLEEALDLAIKALEQPERKNGKWILKKELVPLPWDSGPLNWDNYDEDTHSEWKEYYHCSNCDWKSGEFKGGNFCSNCGSYNGGEQDDSV